MVSTNTDFTIDPVSGVIATGRVFDWETEPIRQFVFQVTTEEGVNDVGVPASRATVTIDLYVSHKNFITLTSMQHRDFFQQKNLKISFENC